MRISASDEDIGFNGRKAPMGRPVVHWEFWSEDPEGRVLGLWKQQK